MSSIHRTTLAHHFEDDNIVSPLELQDDRCFNGANPGTSTNQVGGGEEVVWKIVRAAFKGWFAIWVIFAIIIISAELTSSSGHKSVQNYSLPPAQEPDAQTLLHTAEEVTERCSFSNIKSEIGRSDCQEICSDHLCCFSDDEGRNNYGCKGDPEKICSVYVGCETLFGPEENDFDSVMHNQDGIETNSVQLNNTLVEVDAIPLSFTNESEVHNTPTNNPTQTIEETSQQMDRKHQTTSGELEVVARVVTAVCSNDNLSHGLRECAELCNPSMCCFNRTEIEARSPHMDIVLKLEGVTDEMLDRSVMGTCMDENDTSSLQQNHFCQVHSGCKNLLLIGSSKNRDAFSRNSNPSGHNLDDASPQHTVVAILILFGLTIAMASYMLICNRLRLFNRSECAERGNLVEAHDSGEII